MCPQHLQQQDLFHEQLVHARASWPNPYSWGLMRVDIDEAAIKSGDFRLTAMQGIMPGGMPLDFGDGDTGLPPARIDRRALSRDRGGHRGVPRRRRRSARARRTTAGATAPGSSSVPRYEAWSRDVVDLGARRERGAGHVRAATAGRAVRQRGSPGVRDDQGRRGRRNQGGGFELVRGLRAVVPARVGVDGAAALDQGAARADADEAARDPRVAPPGRRFARGVQRRKTSRAICSSARSTRTCRW